MRPARLVVEDALREAPDSEARWGHVVALHLRGDDDSFAAGAALLDSADPERRALGADVLAQLGARLPRAKRPLADPASRLLLERIGAESDPGVLGSITGAFVHLDDPRSIPALHALRDHPHEDVRYGVVVGLSCQNEDLAVEALVELSRDPDADVREYATFGLGALIERDDRQVREALAARLDDPHSYTRDEGIAGLALRGDGRALAPLLTELERDPELRGRSNLEDATLALAARSPDARLCSHVARLRREREAHRPDEPLCDDLRAAVEACERIPGRPGDG